MGCDIHLYCEGYIARYGHGQKRWINIDHWRRNDVAPEIAVSETEGFSRDELIGFRRDYYLFYLLAGIDRIDGGCSFDPISAPKGFPDQMDTLVEKELFTWSEMYDVDLTVDSESFHHMSYLTLKEIKDSGYYDEYGGTDLTVASARLDTPRRRGLTARAA